MKYIKTQPILSILNNNLVDSISPATITFIWNYGSLLGVCLGLQIITGVALAI